MLRRTGEEATFLMDADRAGCATRFEVTSAEEERGVDGGARKEFKMRASLKLSSADNNSSSSKVGRESFLPLRNCAARTNPGAREKTLLTGLLAAKAKRLENQTRFVTEKIGDVIQIENCPQGELMATLRELGYDPDPLVMWEKESLALIRRGQDEPQDEDDETAEETDSGLDDFSLYNYLLEMPLWSLTRERRDALFEVRDEAKAQLAALRRMSFENTNVEDLDSLFANLLESDDSEEPNDASKGHPIEGSPKSTEAKPSTSTSSALPNLGARNGFRKAATGGGKRPRSRRTATAAQNKPAARRLKLAKRVHCWFSYDPYQHAQSPWCSNGDRPTAASSLQDDQVPSTSTAPKRERAADAKKGFNTPDRVKNAPGGPRAPKKAASKTSSASNKMRTASDLDASAPARSAPPPRAAASSAFTVDYDLDTDSDY
ncbi:hypothetical protein HPB49_002211 [Dermacentor silvarum]|uniref:Uncharacterized protein n=1 Tax=Dermacentor silvarum TaxID=543639 RepID=A0ACB8DI76_DERSI|nr:hypothetical protein HPB49_002211 [Dermacentor silvarum]